jgi:phage terminase large subunit
VGHWMNERKIVFDYQPREQFLPLHQRTQRWACMVCHRRAGKTVASVNELVLRAMFTKKKNARYAYVAPFYSQAKDIAWVYLKEATANFATRVRESDLRVELPNGAWITLYGADNPDRLRGLYFMGVVLDEYGDCRPSIWDEVLIHTLADHNGWALFIGTPKGKNHFYQVHKNAEERDNWYSLVLKVSESGILSPEQIADLRENTYEVKWQQEMECSFTAAVAGTYYADMIGRMEQAFRISDQAALYDPQLPVKCAADLGRTDNTAFWFWQETPSGINFIDYFEDQGKHLDYYIKTLKEKGYRYEEVWLPHDAVAKTLATKRSTIEQMIDAGFPCRKVPKLARQHGIDAVRLVLPHCHINLSKCFSGIEALRAYRRKFNELTKQFSDEPLHDWASDGADAMRYAALVCKETIKTATPADMKTDAEKRLEYPFSLDDLHREREAANRFKQRVW